MPSEIAPHHGEELWRLPYSLAQLARMYEDGADLGGCVAPRGDIGRAERTEVCSSSASRSAPPGKPLSNAKVCSKSLIAWGKAPRAIAWVPAKC